MKLSLRYKISIAILLIFSVFLILDYIALKRTILPAFSKLELDDASQNNRRLIGTIDNELNTLVTQTIDWGEWDLTNKFVNDHNEDYIQNNLIPEQALFEDEQLALIFIIDVDGNLVWGNVYDQVIGETQPISSFFLSLEDFIQYFLEHTSSEHNEHGIIASKKGPMLISSNAILNNAGEGPMKGLLMMGRLINGNILTAIEEQTQLEINYWSLEEPAFDILQSEGLSQIPLNGESITLIKSEDKLSTYLFNPFLFGEGGVLFRIDTGRHYNAIGKTTIRLVSATNLILVLIIMVALIFLLREIVTQPLTKLKKAINSIEIESNSGSPYFKKLYTSGSDEIGSLAKEFDSLLDSISDRDIKLQFEIGERKKVEKQLFYFASHDPLTGLLNRREIEKRIEALISSAQETKHEHVLCFIDLDQFKIINDTCGHAGGDEVLRQVTEVLEKATRKEDTLARIGGDEFGVLMEQCSLQEAVEAVSIMLESIRSFQFFYDNKLFKVGASIGLASINNSTQTLSELLKQADTACYIAKSLGRNCVHIFHNDDLHVALQHGQLQWVTRINEALENNHFCLYAQEILPLKPDNKQAHYEVLIRLKDETGNIISPDIFLPVAERYDLISNIDRWVIKNTFSFINENVEQFKESVFFSINLSGRSITEPDFLLYVEDQVKGLNEGPNKIIFEITETSLISNLDIAKKFISSLKNKGCKFALDDFGSGLSSFNYLKNLEVDYLKIDGVFIENIVNDPIDQEIVRSINDIGHIMEMKTIAEFVKDEASMTLLKEIGLDYAQGDVVGKPQALSDFFNKDA